MLITTSARTFTSPSYFRGYLSDIVRAGLEPHRAAIEAQAVRVEVNGPEDLEVHIARSRVERVIENLVANALEAMPGGGNLRIAASGPGESATFRLRLPLTLKAGNP